MNKALIGPLVLGAFILAIQKGLIKWRVYVEKTKNTMKENEQRNQIKRFFYQRYNLLIMIPLALMIYGVIGEQLSEVKINYQASPQMGKTELYALGCNRILYWSHFEASFLARCHLRLLLSCRQ